MSFWRRKDKCDAVSQQDNEKEREEVKQLHRELQERLRVLQHRHDVAIVRTRLPERK